MQSHGEFIFESSGKLTWLVTEPVQSRTELYADRIVQKEGQETVMEFTADQHHFVTILSDVFFGILSGKLPDQHFEILRTETSSGWQLQLMPIDPSLSQVFIAIFLEGAIQLKQLRMIETNGDQLQINFQQMIYR